MIIIMKTTGHKSLLFLAFLFFFLSFGLLANNLKFSSTGFKSSKELESDKIISDIINSSGEWDYKTDMAVWFGQEVQRPSTQLARLVNKNPEFLAEEKTNVLAAESGEKWIEIDLSRQRLLAHEGERIVYDFPVSTGLPWMPTVTGEFRIWAKVRAQRMSGGVGNDYYDLPNVPFVQYFYKGYGLHGTYWHNDFGIRPRSHGCVNLSISDAEKLFYWANPPMPEGQSFLRVPEGQGTRVVVHGATPTNDLTIN